MNSNEFWSIVERVHAVSPKDMAAKCEALAAELRRLALPELESFAEHLSAHYCQAYTQDIWGAAFVIMNGCGDDSFMDFRYTLVSLGRAAFDAAMANADSLADFDIDPAWAAYEGYQYVPGKVYQEKNHDVEMREKRGAKQHPKRPAGTRFQEWRMSKRFPRLVAKYGYRDSNWMNEKQRGEKGAKIEEQADVLKSLMLEGGVIPRCGLIPPAKVVAEVMRTGRAPDSSGFSHHWEPFSYDEAVYWRAVYKLENANVFDLSWRPDLDGVKLRLDLNTAGAETYDQWLQNLRQRGVM